MTTFEKSPDSTSPDLAKIEADIQIWSPASKLETLRDHAESSVSFWVNQGDEGMADLWRVAQAAAGLALTTIEQKTKRLAAERAEREKE